MATSSARSGPKTVLFLSFNSSGHLHSGIAIANRLKQEHGLRCVFLLVGPSKLDIQKHGHELIVVQETNPLYDYEIEVGEDASQPVDEQLMRRQGKVKRPFEGADRWPQFIARNQHLCKVGPKESYKLLAFFWRYLIEFGMFNSGRVEQAVDELNPDLIISDSLIMEPCLLRRPERPWVRLNSIQPLVLTEPVEVGVVLPAPFCGFKLYNKQERQRMRLEEPQKWQAIQAEWRRVKEAADEAYAANGQLVADYYTKYGCRPPQVNLLKTASPYLNIYMYPEALDYDQDDDLFMYPSRFLRCNSLIEPVGEAKNVEWARLLREKMVGRDSLVYFSLGTVGSGSFPLVQRFVDLLASDSNRRRLYVVSKGANGDQVKLHSSNMIGGNYLPQTFLLQHVHLAIIHGGNNSTTECVHYGVPMVVLPNFTDQLDNAQRVEDLGLGRRLELYSCTGEQLVGAVDELCADVALRERARAIGVKMRQLDELGKVAAVVKELAEQKEISETTARKYAIDLGRRAEA